jgi:hypothetical protein
MIESARAEARDDRGGEHGGCETWAPGLSAEDQQGCKHDRDAERDLMQNAAE